MQNRYFIRAFKYLFWLLFLVVMIVALMVATGTARLSAGETFTELFTSRNGLLMLVVIVVLAVLYPRFGYSTRIQKANFTQNRDAILKAFEMSNYHLEKENSEGMFFRANHPVRRAVLLWEDRVTVTGNDEYIYMEGVRKEIVKIEYRLRALLQ